MVKLTDFESAIKMSGDQPRHLLLGNGFSIACEPGIFRYESLYETANFDKNEKLPRLFDRLDTRDFEAVIRVLEDSCKACKIYEPNNTLLVKNMKNSAEELREALLRTIADKHPRLPSEIDDGKYFACKKFLSNFISLDGLKGKVYTLNYDLLLYWTLLNDSMEGGEVIELMKDDGFGRIDETPGEYVQWLNAPDRSQRIYYLHGAVHLFDDGAEVYKYTWSNTGTPLLEQAQEAMKDGKLPLFVAEGTSKQKLTKIRHSAYLNHSHRSFIRLMDNKSHSLFVYGCSFGENDRHITEVIANGKLSKLYVALYEDADKPSSRKIIEEVQRIQSERNDGKKLNVEYFDAKSARVWG